MCNNAYRKLFEMKKFANNMLAAAMIAAGIAWAGSAFAQTDMDAKSDCGVGLQVGKNVGNCAIQRAQADGAE